MAPKVRKRPAAAILKSETGASYSMMARAGNERIWDATKEFNELAHRETPYGPILKHMDLQRHDGSYFRLGYACPFALFFLVCTETPHLFPMLVTHIGGAGCRVVSLLYGRDTTRQRPPPRDGAGDDWYLLGDTRLVSVQKSFLDAVRTRASKRNE